MPKGKPSEAWINQYGMAYSKWRSELERRTKQRQIAAAARRKRLSYNQPWGPPQPYMTPPPTQYPAVWSSSSATTVAPIYFMEEPKPHKVKDLGIAIEPIVGYRMFQLTQNPQGETCLLGSFSAVWPFRKPLHALCNGQYHLVHDAPFVGCSCGIYAWDDKHINSVGPAIVTGEVYLWGQVLLCDFGYRAEFAYPKILTLHGQAQRTKKYIADQLQENYGVPVEYQ